MYLLGFGIACIPTARQGSLRDPGGNSMTLRELAQRLKKAQQSSTDIVRQILSSAEIAEFTVYSPPTSKWKSILEDLKLSNLANVAVCVTCYNSDSTVFEAIEAQLKKHYKVVTSATVDELGYRRLFGCGDGADKPPQLILCANYYETSREEVKSMYNQDSEGSDTTDDTEDIDIELGDEDIGDPFA